MEQRLSANLRPRNMARVSLRSLSMGGGLWASGSGVGFRA